MLVHFSHSSSTIPSLRTSTGPAGAQRRRVGPDGKALSVEALNREAAQLRASLSTIDERIEQGRRELAGLRANSDEQDIWEANLVMLQVRRSECYCV